MQINIYIIQVTAETRRMFVKINRYSGRGKAMRKAISMESEKKKKEQRQRKSSIRARERMRRPCVAQAHGMRGLRKIHDKQLNS